MGRPRIAYILFDFHLSGMSSWIYRLASQLKNDFDFHFLATRVPQITDRFHSIGNAKYIGPKPFDLIKYLTKNSIDIVQYANGRIHGECAMAARVPVVIERTDGLRSGSALESKSGLDAVIASTKGTASLIQKIIPPEKIHVIYNGIDSNYLEDIKPDRLNFDNNKLIIGRASRITRGKRIDLLISAFEKLEKKYPEIRLIVVGGDSKVPGSEKVIKNLKAMAAHLNDKVVFTGSVEDPLQLIKGFDIGTCVSESDNEGIPNSLIESMALSQPVVTTNTGDVRELIQNGYNGYVVPHNKDEIAKALETFITNSVLRRKMGTAAKETIKNKFSIETQAIKYKDLYLNLLESKLSIISIYRPSINYLFKLFYRKFFVN